MRDSQNSRILAALRGNGWMTTAQIHRFAGFSRLNSRISELRKHGYVIECRRVLGVPAGPYAQEYRLVSEPLEAAAEGISSSTAAAASSGPGTDAVGVDPPDSGSLQLTLEAA